MQRHYSRGNSGESGLYRFEDTITGSWQELGVPRDTHAVIWDLALDTAGRPWMALNPSAGERGIAYLDEGGVINRLVPPGPETAANIWSMVFGDDGVLWVGTDAGVLRHEDGIWARFDETTGLED